MPIVTVQIILIGSLYNFAALRRYSIEHDGLIIYHYLYLLIKFFSQRTFFLVLAALKCWFRLLL